LVRDCVSSNVVSINPLDTIEKIRTWLASSGEGSFFHAYPLIDEFGKLAGIVTRRDLLNPAVSPDKKAADIITKSLAVVYPDNTLREAVDLMAEHDVSLLPVIDRKNKMKVVGVISRTDILKQRRKNLEKRHLYKKSLEIPSFTSKKREKR